MPKNKRELKVGDYVRISRTAKEIHAAPVFGNVGVIVRVIVDNCGVCYEVSALCIYTKGTGRKYVWSLRSKHLKYAKQANKKAGRNVAVE